MTPIRPRYGRIEQLTAQLLKEADITVPPVGIERIVRSRGIAIRVMKLDEVSGLVVRDGSATVIGVNKDHPPTRRRFTIAHELAHVLLHEGKEVRYDTDFRVDFRSSISSLGVSVDEMEANFFAACILMPRHFLEADPLLAEFDAEDASATVATLAKRYNVSAHAMSIRIGSITSRNAPSPLYKRQSP